MGLRREGRWFGEWTELLRPSEFCEKWVSPEKDGVLGHISGFDLLVCFVSDSRIKQWRKEILTNKFGNERRKLGKQRCFQHR